MFSKSHQGIVKKTVVLEFENGYSITLEAGVEMSMHLVMDEAQIKSRRTPRAADGANAVSQNGIYSDNPNDDEGDK